MKVQYRIVELACGKYALERKVSIFRFSFLGWNLVCAPHPDMGNLVETFDTVEEAKAYFFDPMEVKRVVEVLPDREAVL
jgi:hypothetical protein